MLTQKRIALKIVPLNMRNRIPLRLRAELEID